MHQVERESIYHKNLLSHNNINELMKWCILRKDNTNELSYVNVYHFVERREHSSGERTILS